MPSRQTLESADIRAAEVYARYGAPSRAGGKFNCGRLACGIRLHSWRDRPTHQTFHWTDIRPGSGLVRKSVFHAMTGSR